MTNVLYLVEQGSELEYVTLHGKTYTNDHSLNVRKLTDSYRIANRFGVILTLCTQPSNAQP